MGLALPCAARADAVRLLTGEVIHGQPLEDQSTPETLVLEDLGKGSLRSLSWTAVVPEDRDRLQQAWLLRGPEPQHVHGVLLDHEISPGAFVELPGVVESETDTRLRVRLFGEARDIPRSEVTVRTKVALDPREVYEPQVLTDAYAKRLAAWAGAERLAALPLRAAMRRGEQALQVGAFGQAALHFEQALAGPTFAEHAAAERGLATARARLGDEKLLERLRAARRAIAWGSFREARARLDTVSASLQAAGNLVRKDRMAAVEAFERARGAWLRAEVGRRTLALLEPVLRSADVDDRDFADACAWVRRECADGLFAAVARALLPRDAVAAEEVRAAWETRRRHEWSEASYGPGTWIAIGLLLPLTARPRVGAAPPTREAWWSKTPPDERRSWLQAHFVESSGLFEVEPRAVPCVRCRGAPATPPCPRCHGALFDKVLRYR